MDHNSRLKSSNFHLRNRPTMSSDGARTLQAFGNLSSINVENRNAVPLSTNYLRPSSASTSFASGDVAPPLPPRPSQTLSNYSRYRYPGMGGYCSPWGGYGFSQPYGFRGPYNHYGPSSYDSYNSFVQMAEESSRPAFESIESVVEVFSSISMMLESTYHAVHSSYSAVLGVVDQFSRLKDHLAQVLSFLALLKGLRWLCLKILYILRLRKENPTVEDAWSSAAKGVNSSSPCNIGDDNKSSWPFFIFLGLVIGAPWLMCKLLAKNMTQAKFDLNSWRNKNGHIYVSHAIYDFTSARRGELSFRAGEKIYIAPEEFQRNVPKGWILACNAQKETGLVPGNYFQKKAVHINLAENNPATAEVIPSNVPQMLDSIPSTSGSTEDFVTNFENESISDSFNDDIAAVPVDDECKADDKKEENDL